MIPGMEISVQNPEHTYREVIEDLCLTCDKLDILDVYLRINHSSSQILRNVECEITKEPIDTPVVGRRGLSLFGCDNREMLMTAKENHGEDIDVAKKLHDDGREGQEIKESIATLFRESFSKPKATLRMTAG